MTLLKLIPVCLASIIICVACANKVERVEKDFGTSYRTMIKAQIYNPDAAHNPPASPPTIMDGQKGELILETYRKDVAKPETIEDDIKIQIGR